MAPSTQLVAAMELADKYLYAIGFPILMLTGTIAGNILNLIVFIQKNMRKNPCSVYFIVSNVASLIFIYTSLLSFTLDVGYNIDPSKQSLPVCRLRIYLTVLLDILTQSYLVLASIDRILITSPNALTRQRSSLRLAYTFIFSVTLFWTLCHSHALFLTKSIEIAPNYFLCYYPPGIYLGIITYYAIIKQILAVSLMIICGLLASKNIRRLRSVRPVTDFSATRTGVEGNLHSVSAKDRQLIVMLLMDITIYIVFGFVYGIFLVYQQITMGYTKSIERVEIENVVRNLCLFSVRIPLCTSCYTNLLASKTFRKEVKKVLSWKRLFCME